jgi:aminopeptidase-like protein
MDPKALRELSMLELAKSLYPMPRSLTGEGIDTSFDLITHKNTSSDQYLVLPEKWKIPSAVVDLNCRKR